MKSLSKKTPFQNLEKQSQPKMMMQNQPQGDFSQLQKLQQMNQQNSQMLQQMQQSAL